MENSHLFHHISWTPADLTEKPLGFRKVLFVVAEPEDNKYLSIYRDQLKKEGCTSAIIRDVSQVGIHLEQDLIVVYLPHTAKTADEIYESALSSCNSLTTVAQLVVNYRQNVKHTSCKLFSLITQDFGIEGLGYAPLHGLARALKMEIPEVFGGLLEEDQGTFPLAALQHAQGFDYVKVLDSIPHSAALRPLSIDSTKQEKAKIHAGASYLITGGTRGMGLEIASWFGEHRAGNIILVSRNGQSNRTPETDQDILASRIRRIEASGCKVHHLEIDVSKQDAETKLARAIKDLHIAPVKGVVHAAGVAAYNTLDRCPASDMATVLAPKIVGGLALDKLFTPGELDFFILTSSFGQLVGFPGQLSYAPANSFLDGLAAYRRRRGDNCICIQWTCWRGVGLMAQNPSATRMITKGMVARGFGDVSKEEALQAFGTIISSVDGDHVAVVRALGIEDDEPVRHPMLKHVTPRKPLKDTAAPLEYPEHAIAIVGLACRTSAGETAEDLWQVISTGKSTERQLDEGRFPDIKTYDGKMWAHLMADVDSFDHQFFKKSKREAAALDPHQRVLLETVYHALESAGEFGGGQERRAESHQAGDRSTGCFVGMNAPDYPLNLACNPPSPYTGFGMLRSFVCGRLSHYFGWTGPSQTIDTACSSAMVAIHQACRAIQAGECTRAVACGVNLITNTALFHAMRVGGFLNPNGPCKTFDAEAAGYCRGEAVGAVILKPLKSALQDGDDIKGILLATGNNQNINNTSITNPVLESQSALYKDVLARAGVEPNTVSYVEAHGTGTRAGDPVEVQGVRQVLGGKDRHSTLHIGAVKPNIGHSEGASGIISLIKVLLMMKHGQITPQANFHTLNPNIAPLGPDMMAISTSLQEWRDDARIALVNSYGASGSNAAAVVAPPPRPSTLASSSTASTIPMSGTWPIFISAASRTSLLNYCEELKARIRSSLAAPEMVSRVAFALTKQQNRRLQHVFSTTITSLRDLETRLSAPSRHIAAVPDPKPVVLLFSGQNGDTVNPARALYDSSQLFRTHLHRCDDAIQSLGLPSLFPAVLEGIQGDASLILRHAALFAIQYSSGMAWIHSGVKPEAICGHSFGEWAALTVSGALTLRSGMQLVTGRASIIQRLWGEDTGSMVAIEDSFVKSNLTPDQYLEPFREKHPTAKLDVACHNGPDNYVVAGSTEHVDMLESWLTEQKASRQRLRFKVLRGMHAYHSVMADPIVEESAKLSASLTFQEPEWPFESCHKDPWTGPGTNLVARNTREPVYFAQALARIVARLGPSIFLEAGIGGPIVAMARNALAKHDQQHSFVPVSNKNPMQSLADATIALWTGGQTDVQFWPFHKSQHPHHVPVELPQYKFEKASHWLDYIAPSGDVDDRKPGAQTAKAQAALCANCSVNTAVPYIVMDKVESKITRSSVFRIDPRSDRYKDLVSGHVVVGSPICPAAMYLELAAHAVTLLPEVQRLYATPEIGADELAIKAPLSLDELRSIRLILDKEAHDAWRFELRSNKDNTSLTHATGRVTLLTSKDQVDTVESEKWTRILKLRDDADSEALRGTMVYKVFASMANYSMPYQGLRYLVGKDSEAVGEISMSASAIDLVTSPPNSDIADTLIVDNFLQVPGAFVHSLRSSAGTVEDGSMSYICTGMGAVRPLNNLRGSGRYRAYTRVVREDNKEAALDVFAFDEETRKVVWSCKGLTFTKIPRSSLARALAAANPAVESKAPMVMASQITSKPAVMPTASKVSSMDPPRKSKIPEPAATEVLDGVKQVLALSLDIPSESIAKEATLEDLGVDSLVASEVLSRIADKFHVDIPVGTFASIKDVKALCSSISTLGGGSNVGDKVDDDEDTAMITGNNDETTDNALARVIEILGQSLQLPAEEIQAESTLEDLGVDSLVALEIRNGLEQEFGCDISPDDFASAEDVSSLCLLVGSDISTSTSPVNASNSSGSPRTRSAGTSSAGTTTPEDFESEGPILDDEVSIHKAFQSVRRNFDIHAEATKLTGYWKEVYPQQLVAVAAFITEAFETLGCPIKDFRPGERLPTLPKTLSMYHREVPRLWDILEEAGIVGKDGSHYVRGSAPLQNEVLGKSAKELSTELISDFPQFASTHGLPDLLGPHLALSLIGKADPIPLLFGSDHGRALLADFYANGPDLRACTGVLCDFFRAAIRSQTRDGEPFRVLEIGAGTGGTTKYLISLLQESGVPFEYTFTELSGSLLARARNTTFKGTEHMDFRKMDVDKEPPAELLGRYHIAVSSNCVHATPDLSRSLGNIRRMLRPRDGCVALVELTQKLAWYDLVWGLLEGWWLFDDGRGYALQSPWAWERVMTGAGFAHVDWSESASRESRGVRVICGMVRGADGGVAVRAKSVLIHRGGPSSAPRNLFLCPDGFGNGAVFRALAPSLSNVGNVSVYALTSPFIQGGYDVERPPAIEELAGVYVAEIKRRQPEGPYMLGGYSFGGLVAYEAARQLLEDGAEVERLFLIDVACPTFASSMPHSLVQFIDSINSAQAREVSQGQRIDSDHFNLAREQLATYRWSKLPGAKTPQVVLFSARAGVDKQDTIARPEVQANERKVVEWFLDDRADGPLGWDEIFGDVRVIRTEGNHFSMMLSPQASTWGQELADILYNMV